MNPAPATPADHVPAAPRHLGTVPRANMILVSPASPAIDPRPGGRHDASARSARPVDPPQIRLHGPQRRPLHQTELRTLFAAIERDDAKDVVDLLQHAADLNVKDPDSNDGRSLVMAAAQSKAWRVVCTLASLESVVDEPVGVDGRRACDEAAIHARAFDPLLMSRWQQLLQNIDRFEDCTTGKQRRSERFEGKLARMGRRLRDKVSPSRRGRDPLSATAHEGPLDPRVSPSPVSVESLLEPAEIAASLHDLFNRLGDAAVPMRADGRFRDFVELDFTNSFTRTRFKHAVDACQESILELQDALGRWGQFIDGLMHISQRALPDPAPHSDSLYSPVSLQHEGDAGMLMQSLRRRERDLSLTPMDASTEAATIAALEELLNERTPSGKVVPMTRQHILLAQRYFDRLPDDLLREVDRHHASQGATQVRHLMAGCLTLARNFLGRRDDADKRAAKLGGGALSHQAANNVRHAEAIVLHALDFHLARGLVGRDLSGVPLPDGFALRGGRSDAPSSPLEDSPSSTKKRHLSASPTSLAPMKALLQQPFKPLSK